MQSAADMMPISETCQKILSTISNDSNTFSLLFSQIRKKKNLDQLEKK